MKMQFMCVLTIIFILLFSGCADQENPLQQNSSSEASLAADNVLDEAETSERNSDEQDKNSFAVEESSELPSSLTVTLEDNLSIHAEVTASGTAPYITYLASVQNIDHEVCAELLLQGDAVVDETILEDDDFSIYNATSESGATLSIEASTSYCAVNYASDWVHDVSSLIEIYPKESMTNWDDFDNRDKLPTNVDLSFSNMEDAISNVRDILGALGISVNDYVDVYCLDHETLQSLVDYSIDTGKTESDAVKTSWSTEDDCYYMVFRCDLNDIPVSTHDAADLTLISGTEITVCYNVNGIQLLSIKQPYTIESEYSQSDSLVSIDELQAAIQKKYSSIIITGPTVISNIELCYSAVKQSDCTFLLEPTWLVEVEQATEEAVIYSYIRFSAVTGKEL